MEEAKIRRQPPEKELSRSIALVVGGGSGIGREVALLAAARGAHVMIADRDLSAADKVAGEVSNTASKEMVAASAVDIRSREAIRQGSQSHCGGLWRYRHPHQYGRHVPLVARWRGLRRHVGH